MRGLPAETTHVTLLVLALGNVLPQSLHRLAVRGDLALLPLGGALAGVSEEQEALLLLPKGGLRR